MKHILFLQTGGRWYYEDGKLYKSIFSDGAIVYYKCDEHGFPLWHREDGPAWIVGNKKEWYFNSKKINVKSQKEFEKWLKLKAFI